MMTLHPPITSTILNYLLLKTTYYIFIVRLSNQLQDVLVIIAFVPSCQITDFPTNKLVPINPIQLASPSIYLQNVPRFSTVYYHSIICILKYFFICKNFSRNVFIGHNTPKWTQSTLLSTQQPT